MANYSNYFYNGGYLSEVIGYKIIISVNEYLATNSRIMDNISLTPEIIGSFLGRAHTMLKNVPCKICKKDIAEFEAIEQEITNTLEACHKNCYEEYKKKNE